MSLASLLRLIWRAVFSSTIFVAFPWAAIELNRHLGWPRWEADIAKLAGIVFMVGGVSIVAYCAQLFSRFGDAPSLLQGSPERLVVRGLYRFSRNPIYLGEQPLFIGYFLYWGALALLAYAALLWIVFEVAVVYYEEPRLTKLFGDAYVSYTRQVPRWLGRPSERSARSLAT